MMWYCIVVASLVARKRISSGHDLGWHLTLDMDVLTYQEKG